MVLFNLVFLKVLSSIFSVVIGFISGKYSNVEKDSIAALLFYFVAPIVFFAIPTSTNLSFSDLGVTILAFSISTVLGCLSYIFYGIVWQDKHRNMLALSAGTGNSGYVVLPIATVIFDDYTLSIYALGLIGVGIYEASIGCYFCAKSVSSARESLRKVARLPILNAFFLGCIMSLSGFQLPDFLDEFTNDMKGAYAILGMVMIGVALADIKEFKLDIKFTAAAFASKFFFFPLAFNIFIGFDMLVTGWYDSNYYNALQLLAMSPMATNTIVLASLYKIYPEKVATAVLLSLIFVLIYMPVMATIFLNDVSINTG